ncbi:MAG TPA: DUF2877 domain-containing protein [Thermoanaerobaculia bacterium]
MSSSDSAGRLLHAATIGPAASAELRSGTVALRVHSVFTSALNIAVGDRGTMIAITGPGGRVYPHAIAVDVPVDFTAYAIDRGAPAILGNDTLSIDATRLSVDLTTAQRRPHRSIPAIANEVSPCLAARLAAIQASRSCDLRIDELIARRSFPAQSWPDMVSWLIGFGRGLTPAGDDFVCGLLAAAHARGARHLLATISTAIESNLQRTSDISASFMRLALRDYWLEPLIDLACAVARFETRDSRFAGRSILESRISNLESSLEQLCAIGHTSGADTASGFVFGLHVIPVHKRAGSPPKERSYI